MILVKDIYGNYIKAGDTVEFCVPHIPMESWTVARVREQDGELIAEDTSNFVRLNDESVNQYNIRILGKSETELHKDIFRLKQALSGLTSLKAHKDRYGKTEFYESSKELAWQFARDTLNSLK